MYKTTIAKTIEAITEHLENCTNDELVNYNNIYCRVQNYSDDEIYSNDDEFFNMFFESKTLEAVRAVCYGNYNYTDDYVKFNGMGNLDSFNNVAPEIEMSAIADDILENPENYDIELQDCFILDGVTYEGTEEEAKEQYNEYKEEVEESNKELEEDAELNAVIDKEDILTFEEWVKDNIATID